MAASKAGAAGVPKTRSATKEESEKANAKKLQDALNGNISGAKAQVANSQANVVGSTPETEKDQPRDTGIESQSKPPYGLPEDAHQSDAAEQKDTEMGETSESHSEGYLSSDSEPKSSKSNTTSQEDDPDLLLNFESLTSRGGQQGVVDGFGGKGRSRFFILREGHRDAPRYFFERTNACSTEGFKSLSHFRISALKYEDDRGEMQKFYSRENIKGISGIAIEERDETREYKNANQTWIKIKWKGIRKEHKHLLCKLVKDDTEKHRHSSWIPRADLIELIGRKATDAQLKGIWNAQEERYLKGLTKTQSTYDRSPSPFPLDIFNEQKEQRERSRSLSVAPKKSSSPRAVKKSFEEPQYISETQPTMTRSQPSEPPIKEEPKDDVLFVSAGPPAKETQASDPDDPTGEPTREPKPEDNKGSKEPLRFSFASFISEVSKMEKWSILSNEDREERLAAAEARWYRYKQLREKEGDICKDDEEEEEEL